MKSEERKESKNNWAITPKNFGDFIAHTQAPQGKAERHEDGPKPYWTYSEQTRNGQVSLVKSTKDFMVQLDATQVDFLCYYNTCLTQQIKDITIIKNSDNPQELLGKIFSATNILFDVKEFAIKTGKNEKQARKIVNSCLDVFEDRVYHWFAKVRDPKTHKFRFFPYETKLVIPHYEADGKTGRRIKNGGVILEAPLAYLGALAETGYFYYFPDWFYKIGGPNCQTEKHLALRCIERYYQNKGKDGRGFFTLETAIKYSGLNSQRPVTIKRKDGTTYQATKKRSLKDNFLAFNKSLVVLINGGGYDETETFYSMDPEGKERIYPKDIDYEKGPGFDIQNAYFFFRLVDIQNYKKIKAPKDQKDPKQNQEPKMKKQEWAGGVSQGINPDEPEP